MRESGSILQTSRGYGVALMDLGLPDGIPRPWAAVLRCADRPLPLVVAARVEPLLRGDRSDALWVGAAVFAYLPQTGRVLPGEASPLRWPPMRDGTLEPRRNRWKRLLAPVTARDFLKETGELLIDAGDRSSTKATVSTVQRMLEELPPLAPGASADLYPLGRWRGGDFDYGQSSEPARAHVERDLAERFESWRERSRPKGSFAIEVQAMVAEYAETDNADALAALRDIAMVGFTVFHGAIQHLQGEALADLKADPNYAETMVRARGIHRLFYGRTPAFGYESWQFRIGPNGKMRIYYPELVALSADFLGREWLNGLFQSYADDDRSGITDHMARYGSILAVVAGAHAGGTGDADWHEFKRRQRADADGLPEEVRPDVETTITRQQFWAEVSQVLTRKEWEVMYLLYLAGYTQRAAAEKLGISEAAVSQRRKTGLSKLQRHPGLRDLIDP